MFKWFIMFILAVVAANVSVLYFGPVSTVFNAFFLIGLDLTLRDKIHTELQGSRYMWWIILALILLGGVISFVMFQGVLRIAVASTAAFVLSGMSDTLVFHIMRHKTLAQRVNGSNVAGALVDSVVFPTLAFGLFMPWVVFGQFAAKVLGGYIWFKVLAVRENISLQGSC